MNILFIFLVPSIIFILLDLILIVIDEHSLYLSCSIYYLYLVRSYLLSVYYITSTTVSIVRDLSLPIS
jgi:hypothetical protein